MTRLLISIALLLLCFQCISQLKDFPIVNEPLKRGIYKTYEEFRNNKPSIIDSFYLDRKERITPKWVRTYSVTPKYPSKYLNKRRVKKAWGFSDGEKAYIFHQIEFFQIEFDSTQIGFYGYKTINESNALTAGLIGGAAGSLLYTLEVTENAKRERIHYKLNPYTGIIDSNFYNVDSIYKEQTTKLIVFRGSNKEIDSPFKLSINDTTTLQLNFNEIFDFEVPISKTPLKIYYGQDFNKCSEVMVTSKEKVYVKCFIGIKKKKPLLKLVDFEVGDYYEKRITYLQNKKRKHSH